MFRSSIPRLRASASRLYSVAHSLRQRPILPKTCPSCTSPLPTALPVCPSCTFISGVSPDVTYHELFGLPYEPNPFVIDQSLLKRRFHAAQRLCHPDAWSGKDQQKQELSSSLSTYINHAYQNLLSPYSRAEYLLRQNGAEVSETDQSEDPELLTEIMETREEIERIDRSDLQLLDELAEQNQERITGTVQTIEDRVARRDWPEVKKAAVRLKYLEGIHKAIKQQ